MDIEYMNTKTIDIIQIKYNEQIYNVEIHYNCENDYIEFWLQNKKYGIKSIIFGIPYKNQSKKQLMDLITNNIDSYIKSYQEEYED